jgi:hypothetical protein
MESFKIYGDGDFVQITFDEVYGFPDTTSHFGGYEVRSKLEIKSRGFKVASILWTTTGELFEFYQLLKTSNKKLSGMIDFKTYEGNLAFSISYDTMGHVNIKGLFMEHGEFDNKLHFEFNTDQTFIKTTLQELETIVHKYGTMQGVTK